MRHRQAAAAGIGPRLRFHGRRCGTKRLPFGAFFRSRNKKPPFGAAAEPPFDSPRSPPHHQPRRAVSPSHASRPERRDKHTLPVVALTVAGLCRLVELAADFSRIGVGMAMLAGGTRCGLALLTGLTGPASVSGIAGISRLASLAGLSGLPGVTGLSGLPGVTGLSSLAGFPRLTSIARLPCLSCLPGLALRSSRPRLSGLVHAPVEEQRGSDYSYT